MIDILRQSAPDGLRLTDAQWAEIEQRHSESHRAYHDLTHLVELAGWFKTIQAEIGWNDPIAVYLALLYHDIVYIVGRQDNEAASADLLRKHGPTANLDLACAIIEATANHGKLTRSDVEHDTAYFLDADTAVLGAGPQRFAEYDAGVAAEYQTAIPGPLYKAGRREFFRKMLATKRLYLTDWFHQRLDATARKNLRTAGGF
jgi:predicted metal-dependent HD superfamily phosphohydrolase